MDRLGRDKIFRCKFKHKNGKKLCCNLSRDVLKIKFCVKNLIVLCSFTWSSSQRLDSICSLVGGNIGEFYTSEYNIRDYFLFLYAYFIPPLAVFSVHFCIVSHFLGFSCHFFSSLFLLQAHYFLDLLHVLFAFFGKVVQQEVICRRQRRGR